VEQTQPTLFQFYRGRSQVNRREFQTLTEAHGVDLKTVRFMDIGPGYGDTLDICVEQGAPPPAFVEHDPYFYAFNRLKGYEGYKLNFMTQLRRLRPASFDFILAKGAFATNVYIDGSPLRRLTRQTAPLPRTLDDIERLAAPGGLIVIAPWWLNDGERRKVKDVQGSSFTRAMLDHGYGIAPWLDGHNDQLCYPLTYVKRVARAGAGH
jgi:hypothetical protein